MLWPQPGQGNKHGPNEHDPNRSLSETAGLPARHSARGQRLDRWRPSALRQVVPFPRGLQTFPFARRAGHRSGFSPAFPHLHAVSVHRRNVVVRLSGCEGAFRIPDECSLPGGCHPGGRLAFDIGGVQLPVPHPHRREPGGTAFHLPHLDRAKVSGEGGAVHRGSPGPRGRQLGRSFGSERRRPALGPASAAVPGNVNSPARTPISDLFVVTLFVNSAAMLLTLHSPATLVRWLASGLLLAELGAIAGIFVQQYRGILRSGMPSLAIAAVIKTAS